MLLHVASVTCCYNCCNLLRLVTSVTSRYDLDGRGVTFRYNSADHRPQGEIRLLVIPTLYSINSDPSIIYWHIYFHHWHARASITLYNRVMSLLPAPQRSQNLRSSPLDEVAGPNKVNRQLREVFREAFDHLGGAEWLVNFAQQNDQNARVFVQAISKLLPASASPSETGKIILDIPWLTRDRLAYKEGPMDADISDVLPKVKDSA